MAGAQRCRPKSIVLSRYCVSTNETILKRRSSCDKVWASLGRSIRIMACMNRHVCEWGGSMDETWIVFLAGSSLSFALMMYVYLRVVLRRRAKPRAGRPTDNVDPANRRFLDFLRAEAVSRVNDHLSNVLAQQGKASAERRQRGLESATAAKLVESRRTLQSLFSNEVVSAYDKVVVALDGRDTSLPEAMRLLSEFKAKLAAHLECSSLSMGNSAALG